MNLPLAGVALVGKRPAIPVGAATAAQRSVPVVLKGLGLCKQAALSPLQRKEVI